MFRPDIKDINHKQDFRNRICVTLKQKLSQPLHTLHTAKCMQSCEEVSVTQALLGHNRYISIWFHPSCLAPLPIPPNSDLPKQNWADSGISKISVNPTQVREVMAHSVIHPIFTVPRTDWHETHFYREQQAAVENPPSAGAAAALSSEPRNGPKWRKWMRYLQDCWHDMYF